MDAFIEGLKHSSTTVQALGVSAIGLAGVFITLASFFVIIWLAVKAGGKAA